MTRSALALLLVAAVSTSASAVPVTSQSIRTPVLQPQATTVCGSRIPKLEYSGGPLIQHVKVFDVFYSPGNPFKEMLAGFYAAITQSAYFDWLIEYNVPNYKIGRGSYVGSVVDTNSATTKKTLSDTQVETYLSGLIDANKVPPPDDDILYMIYFPAAVTISLQGDLSCETFCAFHSSYTHGTQLVRYGVIPDVTAGGCAMGCGPASGFQNVTDVSSHELIEAVTDPDQGTGWYDNPNATSQADTCGEIGDICATNQGETGIVVTYTVQKEWSNKLNDCIVVNPSISVNDFTIAVSPSPVLVPAGGSATAMVTLTKKSGMAENVTLSSTNATMVLAAEFAPASATSDNGTSTVTIKAAPNAVVGSMEMLTVKAKGSVVSPSIDVPVTIAAPPDMATPPDMAMPPHGGGSSGGCSMTGPGVGAGWAFAGLLLLALAMRRRRA